MQKQKMFGKELWMWIFLVWGLPGIVVLAFWTNGFLGFKL